MSYETDATRINPDHERRMNIERLQRVSDMLPGDIYPLPRGYHILSSEDIERAEWSLRNLRER